ncbi:hypothetical protein [Halobacillus sp. BBL2006]|uniref:hypothetical protein n=1 Tax=Halobacillus sp. BBL2006 TaxID=1543706 RepID=UPI000A59E3A5|nr:hypothetical protein [Halobacillus sp. BBL2006]
MKAKTFSIIGFFVFFIGMALFLLDFLSPLKFLVPIFTIGGICIVIIATFLTFPKQK